MSVIVNRVRCKKCNDVISSSYRHDYRHCACNSIFIDGGTDYQRCGWSGDNLEEKASAVSDYIDFSLSIYKGTKKKQDSLDDVLSLVKEIVGQVEALKKTDDTYETLHYERELKGHLTEILKLRRGLDEQNKE